MTAGARDDEIARLRDQVRRLRATVTHMQDVLARKNLQLDALRTVWCDGGCPGGVHRYATGDDVLVTEALVELAERNTRRLRKWYETVRRRLGYAPTADEWHRRYVAAAAARTDLRAPTRRGHESEKRG